MELRAGEMSIRQCYRLLTGAIVPRPVAWITTLGPNDEVNLAPFSAFTLLSPSPPMIGFTVGPAKDTAVNVEAHGEFVVNIPTFALVDQVHDSSAEYPSSISEVSELGLDVVPSTVVDPPRLADAPIQFECRVVTIHRHGNLETRFVVGEILMFHVNDAILRDSLHDVGYSIDVTGLDPIGVLTGGTYSRLGQRHTRSPIHGARNPWGVSYPERST